MASNFIPFHQPQFTTTAAVAASGHHKSDPQRKNWFTPLFGLSSEPDYITDQTKTNSNSFLISSNSESELDLNQKQVIKSRKSAVKFTDEKARKLRMLTVETETFHDAMYHSAIASRFASDFSHRFDL